MGSTAHMGADMNFILQGGRSGPCCTLVAVCNAARLFGRVSPEIGTPEWKRLLKVGLGQYGPLCRPVTAAAELGIEMQLLSGPLRYPCILTMPDPHCRGLHAALAIEANDNYAILVNYRWLTGPVMEAVSWKRLRLDSLSPVNRLAWTVAPAAS
jgi:hypothetical protein